MEVRRYEYRIVKGYTAETVEAELNKLAAEGFRVIKCAGAGTQHSRDWAWTLEREILPDHPYR